MVSGRNDRHGDLGDASGPESGGLRTSGFGGQAGAAHYRRPAEPQNIGDTERALGAAAGATLAMLGLGRRSLPGLVLAALGGVLLYRSAKGHCGIYQMLGVDTHRDEATPRMFFDRGVLVEESVTINAQPQAVYDFWRDFTNLPQFMSHLEAVEVIDEKRSRWTTHAPGGKSVSWEAEIINESPGRLIAWRSVEGADVHNAGAVRFLPAPGGRGTQIKVRIEYLPPGGKIGHLLAKLLGEAPDQQVRDDLSRLKAIFETGELATTRGQTAGAGRTDEDHSVSALESQKRVSDALRAPSTGPGGLVQRSGAGPFGGDAVSEAGDESFPASDPPGRSSSSHA